MIRSGGYRRLFLKAILAGIGLGFGAQALADQFPTRPIRIVVPWVVGGSTDVLSRLLAESLSKQIKQSVIVENRPGATGTIGTNSVARARPDGYTLLFGTNSTYGIAPYLYSDLAFDHVRDFAPIGLIGWNQLILCINPSIPATNLKEFLQYTKAHPGSVTYSSAGIGATSHLAMELLNATAGLDMLHIPYKGGAPSLQSVLANETSAAFVDVSTSVPLIEGGQLRAIGTGAVNRFKSLPNVPTIAEAGLPGFEAQTAFGLFAPAGTPPEVVAKLNTALNASLNNPAMVQRALELGFELQPSTPQELVQHVDAEAKKWGHLIKERDIKLN